MIVRVLYHDEWMITDVDGWSLCCWADDAMKPIEYPTSCQTLLPKIRQEQQRHKWTDHDHHIDTVGEQIHTQIDERLLNHRREEIDQQTDDDRQPNKVVNDDDGEQLKKKRSILLPFVLLFHAMFLMNDTSEQNGVADDADGQWKGEIDEKIERARQAFKEIARTLASDLCVVVLVDTRIEKDEVGIE